MAGGQEMAGGSIDAIGDRQTALAARQAASTEADRTLAQALADAHATALESLQRLDAIAAEIDGALTNQGALALDTAIGAREFQKFLLAKQQEISTVVKQARDLGSARAATLDKLHEHYTDPAQA
jgi:hypothetical protein